MELILSGRSEAPTICSNAFCEYTKFDDMNLDTHNTAQTQTDAIALCATIDLCYYRFDNKRQEYII